MAKLICQKYWVVVVGGDVAAVKTQRKYAESMSAREGKSALVVEPGVVFDGAGWSQYPSIRRVDISGE